MKIITSTYIFFSFSKYILRAVLILSAVLCRVHMTCISPYKFPHRRADVSVIFLCLLVMMASATPIISPDNLTLPDLILEIRGENKMYSNQITDLWKKKQTITKHKSIVPKEPPIKKTEYLNDTYVNLFVSFDPFPSNLGQQKYNLVSDNRNLFRGNQSVDTKKQISVQDLQEGLHFILEFPNGTLTFSPDICSETGDAYNSFSALFESLIDLTGLRLGTDTGSKPLSVIDIIRCSNSRTRLHIKLLPLTLRPGIAISNRYVFLSLFPYNDVCDNKAKFLVPLFFSPKVAAFESLFWRRTTPSRGKREYERNLSNSKNSENSKCPMDTFWESSVSETSVRDKKQFVLFSDLCGIRSSEYLKPLVFRGAVGFIITLTNEDIEANNVVLSAQRDYSDFSNFFDRVAVFGFSSTIYATIVALFLAPWQTLGDMQLLSIVSLFSIRANGYCIKTKRSRFVTDFETWKKYVELLVSSPTKRYIDDAFKPAIPPYLSLDTRGITMTHTHFTRLLSPEMCIDRCGGGGFLAGFFYIFSSSTSNNWSLGQFPEVIVEKQQTIILLLNFILVVMCISTAIFLIPPVIESLKSQYSRIRRSCISSHCLVYLAIATTTLPFFFGSALSTWGSLSYSFASVASNTKSIPALYNRDSSVPSVYYDYQSYNSWISSVNCTVMTLMVMLVVWILLLIFWASYKSAVAEGKFLFIPYNNIFEACAGKSKRTFNSLLTRIIYLKKKLDIVTFERVKRLVAKDSRHLHHKFMKSAEAYRPHSSFHKAPKTISSFYYISRKGAVHADDYDHPHSGKCFEIEVSDSDCAAWANLKYKYMQEILSMDFSCMSSDSGSSDDSTSNRENDYERYTMSASEGRDSDTALFRILCGNSPTNNTYRSNFFSNTVPSHIKMISRSREAKRRKYESQMIYNTFVYMMATGTPSNQLFHHFLSIFPHPLSFSSAYFCRIIGGKATTEIDVKRNKTDDESIVGYKKMNRLNGLLTTVAWLYISVMPAWMLPRGYWGDIDDARRVVGLYKWYTVGACLSRRKRHNGVKRDNEFSSDDSSANNSDITSAQRWDPMLPANTGISNGRIDRYKSRSKMDKSVVIGSGVKSHDRTLSEKNTEKWWLVYRATDIYWFVPQPFYRLWVSKGTDRRNWGAIIHVMLLISRNAAVALLLGMGGRYDICNDEDDRPIAGQRYGSPQLSDILGDANHLFSYSYTTEWLGSYYAVIIAAAIMYIYGVYMLYTRPYVHPWQLFTSVLTSLLVPSITLFLYYSDYYISAPEYVLMQNASGMGKVEATGGLSVTLATAGAILLVVYHVLVSIIGITMLGLTASFIEPLSLQVLEEALEHVSDDLENPYTTAPLVRRSLNHQDQGTKKHSRRKDREREYGCNVSCEITSSDTSSADILNKNTKMKKHEIVTSTNKLKSKRAHKSINNEHNTTVETESNVISNASSSSGYSTEMACIFEKQDMEKSTDNLLSSLEPRSSDLQSFRGPIRSVGTTSNDLKPSNRSDISRVKITMKRRIPRRLYDSKAVSSVGSSHSRSMDSLNDDFTSDGFYTSDDWNR